MYITMRVITKIIPALALALSLPLLLAVPALAQENIIAEGLCAGANFDLAQTSGADCSGAGGEATGQLSDLVRTVINLLSAIVGIVAVIMIIVGGLRYITSGGNDANVTSAKNTILYAIIGLIIVALAQVLVRFTLNTLSGF